MAFSKTYANEDTSVTIFGDSEEWVTVRITAPGLPMVEFTRSRVALDLLHFSLQQAFPDLGPLDAEEQTELRAKVERLEAELEPYLVRARKEASEAAWQERLELIVETCCPKFDKVAVHYGHKQSPNMHPDYLKWGWWNGAEVVNLVRNSDGSAFGIKLKSYVGSDNYDEKTLEVPAAWFVLKKDMAVLAMLTFFEEERTRRAFAAIEDARKAKQDRIAQLQKELAEQLGVPNASTGE